MKTFFTQKRKRPVIRQGGYGKLDGGKSGQKYGAAVRVEPADGVQNAQAVDVVVIVWGKRKIHDRNPMRLGFQLPSRLIETCGNIYMQPTIRKDLAENLLPGTIVLDDQRILRLRHQIRSARGKRNRNVVPCSPSLSTATEPPNRVIRVFTHHKPNPNLPCWETPREKFNSKI